MHTLRTKNLRFHHNGDFSGNVLIVVREEKVEPGPAGMSFVEVPFEDLRELVFAYLRDKGIGKLEQISDDELEMTLRLSIKE
jgi:hypothetical protein